MPTTATELTDAQEVALEELYRRDPDGARSLDEFVGAVLHDPVVGPGFRGLERDDGRDRV